MSNDRLALRGIWLAIILLGGVLAGGVAGLLFWIAGAGVPSVLGACGGTLLGFTTIGIAVLVMLAN